MQILLNLVNQQDINLLQRKENRYMELKKKIRMACLKILTTWEDGDSLTYENKALLISFNRISFVIKQFKTTNIQFNLSEALVTQKK